MIFRWAMVLLLAAIVSPARAQSTTSGFDLAKALLDRTVRATGKRTLALPGEAGYGIIAGERRTPGGETELIIVVPDHLVRDPARPNAVFAAPIVSFRAEPTKGIFARLLDQRLAPADGDLAVLAVPKPADMALAPMPTAALDLISAGAPVWATARGGEWSPQPQAGRVAPRGRSMWMNVEGLINAADASGAAIVDQRGLAAMVLGPTQLDRAITQTLPIDVIAARLRDVGNAFELETAVTCKAEFCDTILVFTPAPPAEGAAMPTYQAPPLTGRWQKNDVVALRLQLPRRIVEIAGTRLFACIGRDTDCTIETLLPPPAK